MTQTYTTHRQYTPWHHFVVTPILIANIVVQAVRFVNDQSGYNLWLVIVALALVIFTFTARRMALRAQDRVIRLEERLRLERLLSPADQANIGKLSTRQLIALRFASDEEVPALVRRCIAGELTSGDDIKKSITTWRPDYQRV